MVGLVLANSKLAYWCPFTMFERGSQAVPPPVDAVPGGV
jgi:hypothetical protein